MAEVVIGAADHGIQVRLTLINHRTAVVAGVGIGVGIGVDDEIVVGHEH